MADGENRNADVDQDRTEETVRSADEAVEGRSGGLASLRRVTYWAIGVALGLFVYFVIADRTTPFAGDARVQAFILRVAPEVNGIVDRVGVYENAVVKQDGLLFALDPTPFELAVEQAEARLEAAGQDLGASTEAVKVAQARLDEARASQANANAQAARILELVERGVYARAREDEATAAIDAAKAGVDSAEADLRRAREELGPEGNDNPQVREALAAVEDARYNLSRTTVSAPGLGVVTNLQLAVGQTVNVGQPAMIFISGEDVWLSASMRENSIGVLDEGQAVEIVFDTFPGQIFPGKVSSIGWGIGGTQVDPNTGLPQSTAESGWLTDPQRFPVIIALDEEERPSRVRYGSRATLIVYATGNPIMDAIAWARIRLIALLTYVS